MALFNYATKELTLKIVYYGPGLSGKTTNLQYLHSVLNPSSRGKLLSLSTEADRTLFFDFLPFELGKIRDFSVRFQLYTVPGQIRYNATRKVVLKGADAVVFVADSQKAMRDQNIESYENMKENLFSNNINPSEIPVVIQYNKRDLRDILSIEELNGLLNSENHLFTEASAISGNGVDETFKLVSRLLLKNIGKKHRIEIGQQEGETPQPAAVKAQEAPAEMLEPTAFAAATASKADVSAAVRFGQTAGPLSETEAEVKAETVTAQAPEEMTRDFSNEKIDLLLMEQGRINESLSDMKQTISELRKEIKMLRELQKTQEQTSHRLTDIWDLISAMKAKKSWFRF
jgi:small GTP-binding protein